MTATIFKQTGITDAEWRTLSTARRVAIVENVFGAGSAKAAMYRAKWNAFI